MKNIYSIKTSAGGVDIKDIDGKKGIVTGYFANFNSKDSDGDVILPGAFTKSIGDTGPQSANPRIKHLLNHNVDQPLGVIVELKEDAKGLYYESRIGTHTLGQDFIKMAESGIITEHSIGFRTIECYKSKDDESTNYLKLLQLWEGSSLTAWGANELTPLTGVKAIDDSAIEHLMERQKRIEKFCRTTTASDETIEMLILHIKQLSQVIIDTKATKQPIGTQQDDIKEALEALTIFKKTLIIS